LYLPFLLRPSHTEIVEGQPAVTDSGQFTAPNKNADDLERKLASAASGMLEPLAILAPVRSDSGVIVDFEFCYFNEAGAATLPIPAESLIGGRLCDRLPSHPNGLLEAYTNVVETGEPFIGHEVSYDADWEHDSAPPRVFNIHVTKVEDAVAVVWHDVTDDVDSRHRLNQATKQLELDAQIVEEAAEGIWVVDANRRTTFANDSMANMLGMERNAMLGTDPFSFMDRTGQQQATAMLDPTINDLPSTFTFKLVNCEGEEVWTQMTVTPLTSPDGVSRGGFALVTDISANVIANRRRNFAESMFEQATENAPIGQAIVGLDGTFLEVNPALCVMTGYEKDNLIGMTFQEITHPDDIDADVEQASAVADGLIPSYAMDKRYIRADGSIVWVQLHVSVVRDEEGEPVHFVSQILNIDKQRKAEETAARALERLAYRSTHDPLTDLPNRAKFLSFLNGEMHSSRGSSLAVLFIDIDQFKEVNDGISHSSGDAVLVDVGSRIRSCIREGDVVGRLGGDEFAVVATDVNDTETAMDLAQRIRESVAERAFDTDGSRLHISVSIGVARSWVGATPPEILSRADAALHLAKTRGRNCCQLADRQMLDHARARLDMVHRLHEGIERDEFRPWAQPIIDLESGETVGHEVLARWLNDGGVKPAAEFIDAAEDSGLLSTIGGSVIHEALEQFANSGEPGFLTINASPSQLRVPDFANSILAQLALSGTSPTRLIVEITEQSLLGNEMAIIDNLVKFNRNRIRLYVDDFGTGYSSISTLRDYPISGMKLDKSFSRLLTSNPSGSIAHLVSGLSELAHHLHLDRIAEGVESRECAERLLELGWIRGQGYHFGSAEAMGPDHPTLSRGNHFSNGRHPNGAVTNSELVGSSATTNGKLHARRSGDHTLPGLR
jgi:diguanylate cyclase (GGDEF)-like protein/PAS domain S-box-containing protein